MLLSFGKEKSSNFQNATARPIGARRDASRSRTRRQTAAKPRSPPREQVMNSTRAGKTRPPQQGRCRELISTSQGINSTWQGKEFRLNSACDGLGPRVRSGSWITPARNGKGGRVTVIPQRAITPFSSGACLVSINGALSNICIAMSRNSISGIPTERSSRLTIANALTAL